MKSYENIKYFKELYNKKTFSDKEAIDYFESLGKIVDTTKWELIDEREVDYNNEDKYDDFVKANLANVKYEVLYKYAPESISSNSRDFCRSMINKGKEYTKEEILAFNSSSLNPGLGHNGGSYSIWLYKGGVYCHHKWLRRTYKLITGDEGQETIEQISTNKARKEGFYGPVNEKEVSMRPIDMPKRGAY